MHGQRPVINIILLLVSSFEGIYTNTSSLAIRSDNTTWYFRTNVVRQLHENNGNDLFSQGRREPQRKPYINTGPLGFGLYFACMNEGPANIASQVPLICSLPFSRSLRFNEIQTCGIRVCEPTHPSCILSLLFWIRFRIRARLFLLKFCFVRIFRLRKGILERKKLHNLWKAAI